MSPRPEPLLPVPTKSPGGAPPCGPVLLMRPAKASKCFSSLTSRAGAHRTTPSRSYSRPPPISRRPPSNARREPASPTWVNRATVKRQSARRGLAYDRAGEASTKSFQTIPSTQCSRKFPQLDPTLACHRLVRPFADPVGDHAVDVSLRARSLVNKCPLQIAEVWTSLSDRGTSINNAHLP